MSTAERISIILLTLLAVASRRAGGECPVTKLQASNGVAGDHFGFRSALDGRVAVVGAPQHFENPAARGAAYVYRLVGSTWIEEQILFADEGDNFDQFGAAVAIDGDVIVVGDEDHGVEGRAYVYRLDGTTWSRSQILDPFGDGGDFGGSVAIEGDVIVVGSDGSDDQATGAGAAFVFRFTGQTWAPEQELLPSGSTLYQRFGHSVSTSGDAIIVGAPEPIGFADSGAAYLFRFSGGEWTLEQSFAPPDKGREDEFGTAVAIDGETALVTARYDDNENGEDAGCTYVYRLDRGRWRLEQKLLALDGAADDQLGFHADLWGATAIVVSWPHAHLGEDAGAAFVFTRSGGTWTQAFELIGSDGTAGDALQGVAVHGHRALIGSRFHDAGQGAVWIYDLSAPPADCNSNTLDDACEVGAGIVHDCNGNGIPDPCDVDGGSSDDADGDGIPDECEDCNGNGLPDPTEILKGLVPDCNGNGEPDGCDLAARTSDDCNGNTAPDECDLADGFSDDCNANAIPDECDLADGSSSDCNGNDTPDECDIEAGVSSDLNGNGTPDECEHAAGDLNLDSVVNHVDLGLVISTWGPCPPPPASCFGDTNRDGQVDVIDLITVVLNWSGVGVPSWLGLRLGTRTKAAVPEGEGGWIDRGIEDALSAAALPCPEAGSG